MGVTVKWTEGTVLSNLNSNWQTENFSSYSYNDTFQLLSQDSAQTTPP